MAFCYCACLVGKGVFDGVDKIIADLDSIDRDSVRRSYGLGLIKGNLVDDEVYRDGLHAFGPSHGVKTTLRPLRYSSSVLIFLALSNTKCM